MLLRDELQGYTKQQLLDAARDAELHQYSRLRKAELIDRLVEVYCSEEMLMERMTCLTDSQMSLFQKASKVLQPISVDEVVDAFTLSRNLYGSFVAPIDHFGVFDEVAEAFGRMDANAFWPMQRRKG